MRRILRTLLSCVLLGTLFLAPVPLANAAKSEFTHLMYADISPTAEYTYRVENAAVAEDGMNMSLALNMARRSRCTPASQKLDTPVAHVVH